MKKPNITPGEWRKSYDNSDHRSGGQWFWIETDEDMIAKCEFRYDEGSDVPENNSNLIVTAGNLTNKGYRIEAIEEMYEALNDTLECLINIGCTDEAEAVKNIKQALKNAKYEE